MALDFIATKPVCSVQSLSLTTIPVYMYKWRFAVCLRSSFCLLR